jgi:hypothetical protein
MQLEGYFGCSNADQLFSIILGIMRDIDQLGVHDQMNIRFEDGRIRRTITAENNVKTVLDELPLDPLVILNHDIVDAGYLGGILTLNLTDNELAQWETYASKTPSETLGEAMRLALAVTDHIVLTLSDGLDMTAQNESGAIVLSRNDGVENDDSKIPWGK